MAHDALRSPTAARRLKPIRTPGHEKNCVSAGRDDILEPAMPLTWDHQPDMIEHVINEDHDNEEAMLSDGEDDDKEIGMLSDSEDDGILEGYEDDEDDLLEDALGQVMSGHYSHQSLHCVPAGSVLGPGVGEEEEEADEDEDVLHSASLFPSVGPQFTNSKAMYLNDSIHEEMLI